MYRQVIEVSIEEKKQEKSEKYKPAIYGQVRTYKANMKNGDYSIACSSAEQMAEMSIKAVGVRHGNFSNTLERNHDLIKQKRACRGKFDSIEDADLKELRDAYYAKYPNHPHHKKYNTKEQAEKLGKIASNVVDIALDELDVPMAERDKELGKRDKIETVDDFSVWRRINND